ncbi:hypothetical protein AVEN_243658-1 [Araneus ventricosus]|uniref:Uncharacterized protein n=1 Tax=Araneus ventricosus TaxID=182803 RepID=A0A4Y2A606_ARAVE|nr:hypothetical protein AVEN_243658-1 [Araneus ventricosus]
MRQPPTCYCSPHSKLIPKIGWVYMSRVRARSPRSHQISRLIGPTAVSWGAVFHHVCQVQYNLASRLRRSLAGSTRILADRVMTQVSSSLSARCLKLGRLSLN